MNNSRRNFLRNTGCALGSVALLSGLDQLSRINAFGQSTQAFTPSSYKALVCIYLSGGNDGNNVVIPYDNYNAPGGYSATRLSSGLAIPQSSLLQVNAPSQGQKFGFHPSMVEMQQLYNQTNLAVLCNVGTLISPLNKSDYLAGLNRPYQLFSHADQIAQQQTTSSAKVGQTGWGGRIADNLNGINGAAPLPMIITLAGTALFATGASSRQLAISPAPTLLNQVLVLNGFSSNASGTAKRVAFDQLRAQDTNVVLVKAASDTTSQALQTSAALSTNPTLNTTFPNSTLGNQLQQVAEVIKANFTQPTLGLNRQIFFCSLGGFDTHSGQVNGQSTLWSEVSQAMKAFYDFTTSEMGIGPQVTTFTQTDFGRTFLPGGVGNVGTDHGWGNHQFIMGGSVKGGDFYGTYPTLALGGPDDTDVGTGARGRWIPTTSVDQYAATLATWYGVPSGSLTTVFPAIGSFLKSNMGFMM